MSDRINESSIEVSKAQQFVIDFCKDESNIDFFKAFYGNLVRTLILQNSSSPSHYMILNSFVSKISSLTDHKDYSNTNVEGIKEILEDFLSQTIEKSFLESVRDIDISRWKDRLLICEIYIQKFSAFKIIPKWINSLTKDKLYKFEWDLMSHFLRSKVSDLFNLSSIPKHDIAHIVTELLLHRNLEQILDKDLQNPYSIELKPEMIQEDSVITAIFSNSKFDLNLSYLIQLSSLSEEVIVLFAQDVLNDLGVSNTDNLNGEQIFLTGIFLDLINYVNNNPINQDDLRRWKEFIPNKKALETALKKNDSPPFLEQQILKNIAEQIKLRLTINEKENFADVEDVEFLRKVGLTDVGIISIVKNYYQIISYLRSNVRGFTTALVYSNNGMRNSLNQMYENLKSLSIES